jgi:hypothetical protein
VITYYFLSEIKTGTVVAPRHSTDTRSDQAGNLREDATDFTKTVLEEKIRKSAGYRGEDRVARQQQGSMIQIIPTRKSPV